MELVLTLGGGNLSRVKVSALEIGEIELDWGRVIGVWRGDQHRQVELLVEFDGRVSRVILSTIQLKNAVHPPAWALDIQISDEVSDKDPEGLRIRVALR